MRPEMCFKAFLEAFLLGKHWHVVSLLFQPRKPGALVKPCCTRVRGSSESSKTLGRRSFREPGAVMWQDCPAHGPWASHTSSAHPGLGLLGELGSCRADPSPCSCQWILHLPCFAQSQLGVWLSFDTLLAWDGQNVQLQGSLGSRSLTQTFGDKDVRHCPKPTKVH